MQGMDKFRTRGGMGLLYHLRDWQLLKIFHFAFGERVSQYFIFSACYHSEQNVLSSYLLSKNIKIKIYRTIILPVVLYGCESWSLEGGT